MRKRILATEVAPPAEPQGDWLNLEQLATVEVTSEDPAFPVESAFTSHGPGWRAAAPGPQRLRLVFDRPVPVRRIHLYFEETEHQRTHEFTLKWSTEREGPAQEIVRQQWNFRPSGATTENEDYSVNLDSVAMLELAIIPDIGRGPTHATLRAMRVG